MTEADVVDFFARYGLVKALDGLAGKAITAWFEAFSNGGKERLENLVSILDKRSKKAEQQGKEVRNNAPSRIAERIMNEGSYCTQAVMQEYYAGVLLSSQDEDVVDDEGIFYLSAIHRLSSIQLKAHYIFYQIIKELHNNRGPAISLISTEPNSLAGLTYIRASSLMKALYGANSVDEYNTGFQEQMNQYHALTEHILQGLRKENLIKAFFIAAESEDEAELTSPFVPTGSYNRWSREHCRWHFFFAPSMEGLQLFQWGQGYGKQPVNELLKETTVCRRIEGIQLESFVEYTNYNTPFKYESIYDLNGRKFDR